MEINQENKFKRNFKRLGGAALVCVLVFAVVLTISLCVASNVQPVSTEPFEFCMPMKSATILKDYSDSRLQHVEGVNRYEIHLSIDFESADDIVMSISDGIVKDIDSDSVEGTKIEIEHAGGFVSVYASLDKNVDVKVGDRVQKGQQIGKAGQSSGSESGLNKNHLHFTLFKDGEEVDPNIYLDTQSK